MLKFIDKFLIKKFERYRVGSSFFDKVLYKLLTVYYKSIYFKHPDRGIIAQMYWGRDGGFEHAKNQFNRDKDDWYIVYAGFYNAAKNSIKSGLRILEIGCSAGQWTKRLGLETIDCFFTGVDINDQSIRFASEYFDKSEHIQFIADNITDIDIESYDLVLSCQTMFFLNSDQVEFILNSMKIGSQIVLCEPVNRKDYESEQSEPLEDTNKINIGFSHNYSFLFKKYGFKIEEGNITYSINRAPLKILIVATKY